MKNSTKNIVKKKINLSRKKLIEQPLSIFKKINIENLTKITSFFGQRLMKWNYEKYPKKYN